MAGKQEVFNIGMTCSLTLIQGDFFNVCAILGFVIVTAVLSNATAPDMPKLRQASMPQTIILYFTGGLLVITAVMDAAGMKTPVMFSSTPRGQLCKPGVFVLVEDIVAVEGAGGEKFRKELVARYEASAVFRRLLRQMTWFWGVGSLIVGVGVTVIVYVVDDLDVVFALGKWLLRNTEIDADDDSGWCFTLGVGRCRGYGQCVLDEEHVEDREGDLGSGQRLRFWHLVLKPCGRIHSERRAFVDANVEL